MKLRCISYSIALLGAALFAAPPGERVSTLELKRGELSVVFRDNSESPKILSGVDSLFNVTDAPGFDAFDPEAQGASAGMNFEHIIAGQANPANKFAPRNGRYELYRLDDGASAMLVRDAADDPWVVGSTLKYTLREPNAIDFEFHCQVGKPELFGPRGYAVLFFANYLNDVAQIPINFRGIAAAGGAEEWISADAPPGPPDYKGGGTYRSAPAADLAYDADHDFKLNLWSYDYPRFTQPFYYGRAAHDMVFILMFDRTYSEDDEIRFSIFKFKVPKHPRPAWDFQYVIHRVAAGRDYGFRGRLIWKKFVSAEDCLAEYHRWQSRLAAAPGAP